jgi:hypothetical protein
MSIEERLAEIQRALSEARLWLDAVEALVKQLVKDEKPTLEILARAFDAAEHPPKRALRECGYCAMWRSSPCGEGCCWSPAGATLEAAKRREAAKQAPAENGK